MRKHKISLLCAALCALMLVTAAVPALAEGAEAASGTPVAENLELETYRNVSVGGRLSAVDPEGGALTYEITTEPGKGTVELTKDGRFVYTPDKDRRGRDYFGYKATDSDGNSSQEATVIIRISKQKTQTTYSDMAGDGAAYAATLLAEEGIFTGEKLGGQWVFSPDRSVTRGEFLSMCLELCGTKLLSGVASTGFTDDADIPPYQKPYVATALMDGVISGYSGTSGAAFEPNEPISRADGAPGCPLLRALRRRGSHGGRRPRMGRAGRGKHKRLRYPRRCALLRRADPGGRGGNARRRSGRPRRARLKLDLQSDTVKSAEPFSKRVLHFC